MSPISNSPHSVILIVGPGDETFQADVSSGEDAFERNNIRYTIIGDGLNNCTDKMISHGIARHAKGWTGEDVSVIMSAHGADQWGEHALKLVRKQPFQPTEVFIRKHLVNVDSIGNESLEARLGERISLQSQMNDTLPALSSHPPKIDLFVSSCCSTLLLPCAKLLPEHSTLVGTADGPAWSPDLQDVFLSLSARSVEHPCDFSAHSLMAEHLLVTERKPDGGRYPPSYAVSTTTGSGERSCSFHHPHEQLFHRVGSAFTDGEEKRARATWGQRMGTDRLAAVLAAIGGGDSEDPLLGIQDEDYMPALLVCDAAY